MRSKNPYNTAINDLDEYAIRWQAWWDSLQPAWCGRQGEQWKIYEEYDSNWDWGTLASMGPNGGLSIVASLYFWGAARKERGLANGWEALNQAKWHAAVQDVIWVYEGVEASLSPCAGNGRGRAIGSSGARAKTDS
jgi:hypothetical protein